MIGHGEDHDVTAPPLHLFESENVLRSSMNSEDAKRVTPCGQCVGKLLSQNPDDHSCHCM